MLDICIAPPPPAIVTRALSRFSRDQLAWFITVAIDLLDLADSDVDLEPNGDELDGDHCSEDDFLSHSNAGPGCPIADTDFGDDERGEPDNGL